MSAANKLKTLLGEERVIQSYTHFDLRCIEDIKEEILKTNDENSRFQVLQNIYRDEYDIANTVPETLKENTLKFLDKQRDAIRAKNTEKTTTPGSHRYIDFIYEQYGDETSYDVGKNKNKITFNVACNNKSIEQNEKSYLDFLKPRFKTFMDELYKTKKKVQFIFFGKKSNNMYAINIASSEINKTDKD